MVEKEQITENITADSVSDFNLTGRVRYATSELLDKIYEHGDKIVPLLDGLSTCEVDEVLSYVKRQTTLYPIAIAPYRADDSQFSNQTVHTGE